MFRLTKYCYVSSSPISHFEIKIKAKAGELNLTLFSFNRSKTHYHKLEYGPMPNVMVALPNIGGALCSTPQSLADAHY